MRASDLPASPPSGDPTRREEDDTRAGLRADGTIVLDRYRLHRRLGAGAFGTVWHAHDERLDRDVAVKILPRERIVGGRFEREAKAAARLAHPGIVTLYEAAVDDDGAYLVSELVLGRTLAQLLQDGHLSDRDIVSVGIALCDALDHAHAHGVVHRDVKPSNVLVPRRPGAPGQAAKLTDFGMARVVGGDSLTRTGDVVGTMAYMAPEQAEGLEAAEAADLYSTALVLYEALTGVNPVLTGTVAVRTRRLGAYLPPLRRQRRDLPRELGRGLDLALRPRPRERGTVAELQAVLSVSRERLNDRPGVVSGPWPALTQTAAPPCPGPIPTPERPRPDGPWFSSTDRWLIRAAATVAAAGTTAWTGAHLLAPAPLAPAAMARLAGLVTLALPRLGWLAIVFSLGVNAAVQGRSGLALVVLIAGLVPVLLAPRGRGGSGGRNWPLTAVCPALGVIGLAGAWPALAAGAGTTWRRAATGAAGWLWLLLAAPLAGQALYVRVPAWPPAFSTWMASPRLTAEHVLGPLLHVGLLAPAAVWALGAAVLPLIRVSRSRALDVLLVVTWAALVSSATAATLDLGPGRHALILTGEAVVGAVASLVAALAANLAWNAVRPHVADADLQLA